MKITESQLRRIIKEELTTSDYNDWAESQKIARTAPTNIARWGREVKKTRNVQDLIPIIDALLPRYLDRDAYIKEVDRFLNYDLTMSEGLRYHLTQERPILENIYRPGSKKFFSLFIEARENYRNGDYSPIDWEEKELLESDIGEWGVFNGEYVPLDYPMMNEDFSDDYQSGKWHSLSPEELKKYPEVIENLFKIIDKSYSYLGGHVDLKEPDDLFKHGVSVYSLIDVDGDGSIEAARLSKKTNFGNKGYATATDGSQDGRQQILSKIQKDLSTQGFYAEVSGKMAHILVNKLNVPYVSNEETVRKILGKPIEWIGKHESGVGDSDGWYYRTLGDGKKHEKILVGIPFGINEAEYRGRKVDLNSPMRSSGPTKYKVYVKNDKGNVIQVNFGDAKGGLTAKLQDPAARKSFAARHQCEKKKDKTKPGYWACRLPRFAEKVGLKPISAQWW